MLIGAGRVDFLGATGTPKSFNCPSQHARPPQISRNECAQLAKQHGHELAGMCSGASVELRSSFARREQVAVIGLRTRAEG
jgi:hypothetical protein